MHVCAHACLMLVKDHSMNALDRDQRMCPCVFDDSDRMSFRFGPPKQPAIVHAVCSTSGRFFDPHECVDEMNLTTIRKSPRPINITRGKIAIKSITVTGSNDPSVIHGSP